MHFITNSEWTGWNVCRILWGYEQPTCLNQLLKYLLSVKKSLEGLKRNSVLGNLGRRGWWEVLNVLMFFVPIILVLISLFFSLLQKGHPVCLPLWLWPHSQPYGQPGTLGSCPTPGENWGPSDSCGSERGRWPHHCFSGRQQRKAAQGMICMQQRG